MKTTVTAIVAALVLLAGQQRGMAEQPGQDLTGGYFNSTDPGSLLVRGQQGEPLFPQAIGGDPCADCCPYCWQGFGEFLYLRAGNAEITYGMPTESLVTPLAVGRVGVVDTDYQPAFRAGVARRLDECSTIGVSYTQFESSSIDELHVFDPQVLYPLVLNPAVLATDPVWRDAYARHDIDFRLIDADYRYSFVCESRCDAAVLIGARYLNLEQAASIAFYAPAMDTIGDEYLFTNVNFDGGGIRLGLEGERRAANCGLLAYGKTAASFVAGEFRADLFQARGIQGGAIPIVDTSWRATRLVSMLDLEVGVGWTALDGRLRLTGGYMISGWFNTVRSTDWIRAVQTNDFASLSAGADKVMTFDGIVGRAELRF